MEPVPSAALSCGWSPSAQQGNKMPVTIVDVARRAAVGRGTVSRVLNDRPNVDPATRARVHAVIAELGFTPSTVARRLSLGRSQTIGVVVPFLTRPSVVERLRGIESALADASLDMIVFNVETVARRDAVLQELTRRERIDGLVLLSLAPREDELARMRKAGLPIVLIDAHNRYLPRVVVDDDGGGFMAARHLLELGHTRIGFVGDAPQPDFGFSSSRLRLRGAERALRSAGLAIPEEHVALGEHSRSRARELAVDLLRSERRPSALIAASDTQALGILEAATELGLRVPEDVAVIGYDDIEAADHLGLSTIRQPLVETGRRAVARLLELIGGAPRSTLREVLPAALVIRRTTVGHVPVSPPTSASS